MSSGNGKKVRSLRFVARLSGSQHRRLDDVLGMCCELYNAGLEAWRTGYRMWLSRPDPNAAKMRFSYMDNCKTFTQVRADDSRWSALHTNVGRGVLLRLDRSIQGFYDGIRGIRGSSLVTGGAALRFPVRTAGCCILPAVVAGGGG